MIYKHFNLVEFDCRCGKCTSDMNHEFINILDEMRENLGFPLRVSSGYRCGPYNEEVSSSGFKGPHTTGKAVDILIWGGSAVELITLAMNHPAITGFGISQRGDISKRFIHLDALLAEPHRPRPHVWTY